MKRDAAAGKETQPSRSQQDFNLREATPLDPSVTVSAASPNDDKHGDLQQEGPTKQRKPPQPQKKAQRSTAYQRRFVADSLKPKGPAGVPDRVVIPDIPPQKASKLDFSKDEQPSGAVPAPSRRVERSKQKAATSAAKLEKAQKNLPTQRKLAVERTVHEKTGKPKRRLYFEQEVKPMHKHIKGPMVQRPVKFGASQALRFAHRKIHEVEHENVGVEAAHKTELVAEGGIRRAYRLHKTRPYRRVRKLHKKATRRAVKASYRQTLHNNPKLKSSMISRMIQKRRIKKQYAKAARRGAKHAGKASIFAGKSLRRIVVSVVRKPVVFGIIALVFLLILPIFGLISSCTNMGSGGITAILVSSYLAEDEDIDDAGRAYTEWETDLRIAIANVRQSHPSFNEYRYSIGQISHNPFELMAFLTAVYQEFTFAQIEPTLREIFNEQYQLTFTPVTETRTRTEQRINQETGMTYNVEVEYEWRILYVTLTTQSFTSLIMPRMNLEQRQVFELLMVTKGNRQYLDNVFRFNWLPFVSSRYGYRVHPIHGDRRFHFGIDIGVPTGTEILAGHDGTVRFAGNSGGFGLLVELDDGNGLVSRYAHCSVILVTQGQAVSRGDVIALVGSTGDSTGPHLHLEIIRNGRHLNPMFFAITGDDGSGHLPPVLSNNPGPPMSAEVFAILYAEARSHLGTPYVFGANGPDAFDCSSFICWIFTHSGVWHLPRTTAQGIFNQTTPIPSTMARPGDLIFFTRTYSTTDTITHVGLYLGDGRMIHAGSPVNIASINTPFWQNHFFAFGRIPG